MRLGILLLVAALPAAAQTGKISGIVTNGRASGSRRLGDRRDRDLPTRFAKIVVTDERGRFLIPELPKASYRVWVRGYGLVDSKKVKARLGDRLRLKAAIAPNEGSAAQYYPRSTGTRCSAFREGRVPDRQSGEPGRMAERGEDERLRRLPRARHGGDAHGAEGARPLQVLAGSLGARITSGQAMTQMVNALARTDSERMLKQFADWTDRVATGECPRKAAAPAGRRAQRRRHAVGLEQREGRTCTTRSRPTGAIRRSTRTASSMARPRRAPTSFRCSIRRRTTATELKHPVRDPETPSSKEHPMAPSPYWGSEPIWDSHTTTHNPMLDEQGRVWFTARVRPPRNPEFCRKGHPSADASRWTARTAISRCTTRRAASSR
jgi:hypothetical protein